MIFCVFLLTSFTFLLLSFICLLISVIFLLHSFTLLLICLIFLLLSFNCLILSFFREFLTAWIISVLYWITKKNFSWKYISQRGKHTKTFCNRISGDSLLIWKEVHFLMISFLFLLISFTFFFPSFTFSWLSYISYCVLLFSFWFP